MADLTNVLDPIALAALTMKGVRESVGVEVVDSVTMFDMQRAELDAAGSFNMEFHFFGEEGSGHPIGPQATNWPFGGACPSKMAFLFYRMRVNMLVTDFAEAATIDERNALLQDLEVFMKMMEVETKNQTNKYMSRGHVVDYPGGPGFMSDQLGILDNPAAVAVYEAKPRMADNGHGPMALTHNWRIPWAIAAGDQIGIRLSAPGNFVSPNADTDEGTAVYLRVALDGVQFSLEG